MTEKQVIAALRRAEAAAKKASQLAGEAHAAVVGYLSSSNVTPPPFWSSQNAWKAAEFSYGLAWQSHIHARAFVAERKIRKGAANAK